MRALAALFDDGRFRSTVDMARHRFGDGRYRYFEHPLPDPIPALRPGFYEGSRRSPTNGRRGSAAKRSRSRTRSCWSAAAKRARSARRR